MTMWRMVDNFYWKWRCLTKKITCLAVWWLLSKDLSCRGIFLVLDLGNLYNQNIFLIYIIQYIWYIWYIIPPWQSLASSPADPPGPWLSPNMSSSPKLQTYNYFCQFFHKSHYVSAVFKQKENSHLCQLLHLPAPHVGEAGVHRLGAEHQVLDEVDNDDNV